MAYAQRLKDFNDATAATADHLNNIRNAITNPEFEDNPVRQGLETASGVLGTVEGVTRLRRELGERGTLRNTARAFYNRLGNPETLRESLGNDIRGALNSGLQRFGNSAQSLGSTVADNGRLPTRSEGQVRTGARATPEEQVGEPADPVQDRINSFPQTDNSVAEANSINRDINSRVRGALSPDEINDLNTRTQASRLSQANALPDNDVRVATQKEFLNAKNKITNDAIRRKTAGEAPAESYDVDGNPQSLGSQAATRDAGGGASAGGNTADTVAAPRAQAADLPNASGASDIGSANTVTGVAGDIGDTGRAAAVTAEDGADIVARGRQLGLQRGAVPTQTGEGTVQGLTTASTSDSAAGASHIVSQAQAGNAASHESAQAAGSQVQAGGAPDGAAEQADNSAQNALRNAGNQSTGGASRAAEGADEINDASRGASSGIRAALGTEETLDELAPETGPLAPVLEVGSLLATLGTSIASLFEPAQEKKPPPPKPPQEQNLSVGANLKSDATGAVGAF
jgi:hypothetical protein